MAPMNRQGPSAMGRYILCSTARSLRGTMLEVGASVMNNQNVANLIQRLLCFRPK